jgi:hypothetical protein
MKHLLISGLLLMSGLAFAEEQTMTVQHLQNQSSYFKIDVMDSGTLKGSWPGWCADWDRQIEDNTPYNYKFYSSYNQNLPAGLIDKPEFLDEVNWLINQNYVGKNAGGNLGIYTAGDVQLAIWTLIDDNFNTSTVGEFSQARVDKIAANALKYGSNFYPTCRQEIVLVLDPGTPQSTLIEVRRDHFRKCDVPEEGKKL